MSKPHHPLSPSKAHRWMRCAGSRKAEEGRPDSSGPDAERGTAAHEIAAICLTTNRDPQEFLGAKASNGIELDDDLIEIVSVYVRNLRDYAGHEIGNLMVEVEVDYGFCVPGATGTADAALIIGDELQVHDLKTGYNRVEAEGNEQLMIYALGVVKTFDYLMGGVTNVRLVIHQPRLRDEPLEHNITLVQLLAFANKVKSAGLAAMADDAPRTPGDTQCGYCKARADCPALAEHVAKTLGAEFADLTAAPLTESKMLSADSINDDQLDQILQNLDLIELWCKAMYARGMKTVLEDGIELPNFKAVQGRRGNRKWADEDKAEEALKGFRLKKEEMYTFKVISPATAEKRLAPRQWKKIESLITQADGKPTLVLKSDPRPAIRIQPVKPEDFGEVEPEDMSDLIGVSVPVEDLSDLGL